MKRVSPVHVERLAAELPTRDLALIETLDRLRVATPSQLQRLHFASGTKAAGARQTWRRLRALTDARVVCVLERRIGGGPRGSSQAVYALDTAGQKLASACGPAGGRRLRRPWTPGSQFLAHALAVTELYVGLRERERSAGATSLPSTPSRCAGGASRASAARPCGSSLTPSSDGVRVNWNT